MRVLALLVAAALAVVAASASGAPSAGAGCSGVWLQSDAGSGLDAGDVAAEALPLVDEGHYDAALAPPDLVDWYAVELAGDGETVMLEAYPAAHGPATYLAPDLLALTVFAPGAEEPTHVGVPTPGGRVNATFLNEVGGTWRFRVSFDAAGAEAGAACAPDGAALAEAPHTYRLYYGCNPFCLEPAR